jgi:hypothetical protein
MEWLGIIWNSHNFTLSIPERRVNDMLSSLKTFSKNVWARRNTKDQNCKAVKFTFPHKS